jgi:hypothetical protein
MSDASSCILSTHLVLSRSVGEEDVLNVGLPRSPRLQSDTPRDERLRGQPPCNYLPTSREAHILQQTMPRCSAKAKRAAEQASLVPNREKTKVVTTTPLLVLSTILATAQAAAGNTLVGDTTLFDAAEEGKELTALWEAEYERIVSAKYKKGRRFFSSKLLKEEKTSPVGEADEDPLIYVVPRVRGEAYKSVRLATEDGEPLEDIPTRLKYREVSKGYGGQDASSFTLGPVVGEGLVLVNAAFSKQICVMHLEGGGVLDLSRKSFWRRAKKPERSVLLAPDGEDGMERFSVNGRLVSLRRWLRDNEHLWLEQWERWRRAIAMCSVGSFHWDGGSPVVSYRHQGRYLSSLEWKKECYIAPALELLSDNRVVKHLAKLRERGWSLGLAHPMGVNGPAEMPVTREAVRAMYDDPFEHICLPFCLAGALLGVPLYEEDE